MKHPRLLYLMLFVTLFLISRPAASQPLDWNIIDSPTGLRLNSVWGNSINDAFAVGQSGTVARFNGSAFSSLSSATGNTLNDIWGTNSVYYAVGDLGTIVLFNGANWQPVSSPTGNTLTAVWGNSPSNIFAVGSKGTIIHFDGSRWSAVASPTGNNLKDVWVAGTGDAFAVGEQGTILRFDGQSWSVMTSPTGNSINGVWGTSATDVFAVASGGVILHFNGASWSVVTPSVTGQNLNDIFGTGPNDVFTSGDQGTILRFDGTSWSAVRTSPGGSVLALWVGATNALERGFAVGTSGLIAQSDGTPVLFPISGTPTPAVPSQSTPAISFIIAPTVTVTPASGAQATTTPTALPTTQAAAPAVIVAPVFTATPLSIGPVLPTSAIGPLSPVLPTSAVISFSPVLPTTAIVSFSPVLPPAALSPSLTGFVLDLNGEGVSSVLVLSTELGSTTTNKSGRFRLFGTPKTAAPLFFLREDRSFSPSTVKPLEGTNQTVIAVENKAYFDCSKSDVSSKHVLIDRQVSAIRDIALNSLGAGEAAAIGAIETAYNQLLAQSRELPVIVFDCPDSARCRSVSTAPAVLKYQIKLRSLKRLVQNTVTIRGGGSVKAVRVSQKRANELTKKLRTIGGLLAGLPKRTSICR